MLRYHQWGNRGQFLNKSYVNNRNEPKLIFIGKIYEKIHSVALYVKSGPNKIKQKTSEQFLSSVCFMLFS